MSDDEFLKQFVADYKPLVDQIKSLQSQLEAKEMEIEKLNQENSKLYRRSIDWHDIKGELETLLDAKDAEINELKRKLNEKTDNSNNNG